MALSVGSRLGPYAVTALSGEGGRGQVYQATDTKLNRQVALKILPEAFADDPDRLAHFEREAVIKRVSMRHRTRENSPCSISYRPIISGDCLQRLTRWSRC